MEIRLSLGDSVPVSGQIVNQVKYLVAPGRLASNQELPPIRSLAGGLCINPDTVIHAYAEPAREGVIVSRKLNPEMTFGLARCDNAKAPVQIALGIRLHLVRTAAVDSCAQ